MRALLASASLQALGPLSALATVLVVATVGGAQAQGQFAQSKAWVDLLVVLGTFGFPQGIVYVVNRLSACARRLAWYAAGYSLMFVPVAWAATRIGAGQQWAGPLTGPLDAWVLAGAAALLVVHALWRGVCLTLNQGAVFALLTVVPAVALLAAVCSQSGRGPFPSAILISAALAALAGAAVVTHQLHGTPVGVGRLPWRALWANGSHVFLQAVLTVLQPLLAYALVRQAGGGDEGVGLLHVGVFVAQGLVVPVGLVAPLLFARWTATLDLTLLHRLQAHAARWVIWGAVAGCLLAGVVGVAVRWGLGADYDAAILPAMLMTLSLPLAAYTRVLAPAMHAHGVPQANTAAAAWRLACLALGGWLLARDAACAPWAVALAWSVSEAAALLWTLWAMNKLASQAPKHGTAGGAS
ncbi:MAG: hypothetical protein ACT6S0_01025 [Roseateles sp.]|uniref:hypothetical protein n=1 Tax=Roseateles sp. TaxID=1971397 RepID=UPI00403630ED